MVQANIWQLIDTIKGWDNAMELQFKNIVNSDGRLDSALGIWQMVSAAQNALWKNFVKEFESQMKDVHRLENIPEKESEYWFKKPEQGNYGIGLVLKNGSRDNHCIGFCLFDSDGKYRSSKDSAYYTSDASKLNKAKGCLYEKNFKNPRQLPAEIPWLYREKFPEFKDEEINFYSFTKETAKLLFEENLKEYVEKKFICRIKELTGWENQQADSCVSTTSD